MFSSTFFKRWQGVGQSPTTLALDLKSREQTQEGRKTSQWDVFP